MCACVEALSFFEKFVSSTIFKMNDNILITTDADQYWLAIPNNKVQWGAEATSIHFNKKSQPLKSYPLETCFKYIEWLEKRRHLKTNTYHYSVCGKDES